MLGFAFIRGIGVLGLVWTWGHNAGHSSDVFEGNPDEVVDNYSGRRDGSNREPGVRE